MNKRRISILTVLLLLCIAMFTLVACDEGEEPSTGPEHIDYVEQTKLDMTSDTLKMEVTLKYHIDGDTSHFFVPTTVDVTGVMKARYLAVNTPESTGRVEVWGKKASAFTEEKLRNAVSIIVESEKSTWEFDGNGRYLVWVWYQPTEGADYRNLNLELLQNGLAVGSKAGNTRYGDQAVSAIAQATAEKLYIFSTDKDPEYPYGEAESVTLKELRTNIQAYNGHKVAFEGVITMYSENTAYIQEYDPETDTWYGIQLFDGYTETVTKLLIKGNRVRIVGTVGEHWGTWQIASLTYNPMKPKDPANSVVLSKNNEVDYLPTTAEDWASQLKVTVGEEEKTFDYKNLALSTAVSMEGLKVTNVYTTTNPTASDVGAMTLTCQIDGVTVKVRTAVLKDENGQLVTADYFRNATIDVQGIVEYYLPDGATVGEYQIKAYFLSDIVKH